MIPTYGAINSIEIQKPGVAVNTLVASPVLKRGGSDFPKVCFYCVLIIIILYNIRV